MGYSNPVVLPTAASATTSSAAAGVLNPAAMMAASGGLPAALALNPALIPGLNLNLMAQDKINRELFVGNTPPGTSEALLREFLNGALKRVGLAAANHTPVLVARVNEKFAFIECASADDANKALNLNGIPFLGSCLKVSRPSKYSGPHVPAQTWQELTGTSLPPNVTPLAGSADEKISRELFVGNTTPEMTEQALTEFLGKAMEQVGLTTAPGNPIASCRLSGKFAFVELRTKEEAANALNLNNIPFMSTQLRVGRPSKYTGPPTPHGNWEDILAKYMSGELKLPSQGGTGAAAVIAAAAASSTNATSTATRVVVLKNMPITEEELANDEDYEEILEDTKDECSSFGMLKNIEIPRTGDGKGRIFLEYLTKDDAANAIRQLQGRTFDGKKVEATYFDEAKFAERDYSVTC